MQSLAHSESFQHMPAALSSSGTELDKICREKYGNCSIASHTFWIDYNVSVAKSRTFLKTDGRLFSFISPES